MRRRGWASSWVRFWVGFCGSEDAEAEVAGVAESWKRRATVCSNSNSKTIPVRRSFPRVALLLLRFTATMLARS
jgi:hypothetical protein